ncbi:flavodoxin [Anaeromicropila populeti]|uniref:Flavodoxin n=1 Tax=Anaeromicropila populeti TaxID=37658 RepID=A0A1I6K6I1_9FIRM|nr:flavodoxin [Anaeromicropila populeti]SFR86754.1 flavodoxin, short chain [Anaeromicropila populeti]
MSKVNIVFWSGTGNTEQMAKYIAQGVEKAGQTANVVDVSEIDPKDLAGDKAFALGCPSMGAEQLEESVMEPFVEELEGIVSGKSIALFGSYGWGNCEWMRDWEERMQNAGAVIVGGEGITVLGEPDDETKERCIDIGKTLASFNV